MAFASHLTALALAAFQPGTAPEPAPAADTAAVVDLFERVCVRGEQAPAGFETVPWSDFPEPLRLLNTYGHGGTFLRSETPSPTYVAKTEGESHMAAGREMRCGVAIRGADAPAIVARLAERTRARAMRPMEMGGTSMTMLMGDRAAYTVYRVEDGWVIVRSLEMTIAVPARNESGRRERRRQRD